MRTEAGSYVLPPARALWIPAGTSHETKASGAAVLRSAYISASRCPIQWDRPTPIAVNPLLRELIPHLEDEALADEQRSRAPKPSSSTSSFRWQSRRSTSGSPPTTALGR